MLDLLISLHNTMTASVFDIQIRVNTEKCRISLGDMEFLTQLGDFSYLGGCHLGNVPAADEVTLFEGILASGR